MNPENLSYACWTQTTTLPGKPDSRTRTTCWLRFSPPARAWRTEQGRGWSYTVLDERGHLHTDSTRNDCLLYIASPQPTADNLMRLVIAPEPPSDSVFEETIDTRKVRLTFLGWRRVLHYEWEVIRSNFRIQYQVWADPKTLRLVRKEKSEFNLLSGQEVSRDVCERYIYNRKPPAGTFDMPPGKPIVEVSGEDATGDIRNLHTDG